MKVSRWALAIGVLVGCGLLQVQGRHAMLIKGYDVGAREAAMVASQNDVRRLAMEVGYLESPRRLAEAAREQQLTLVAQTALPAPPVSAAAGTQVAFADTEGRP